MDYQSSFKDRAHSYLHAMNEFPNAMDNEFITSINMLNLNTNDVLLNIPAGGVPIDKYLNPFLNIQYIPFDTHPDFTSISIPMCEWDSIPLENNSVDKILCLASLHHLTPKERSSAYREFHRVLKPEGKLVIGDVISGSNQAIWLDNFVDVYNSNGHKGQFFNEYDAKLIEQQGFSVTTSRQSYDWEFNSEANALAFCKLLFGLDKLDISDPILAGGLKNILQYNEGKIPWQLIYFVCSPQ